MNISKIIVCVAFVLILLIPEARDYATSLLQRTTIGLGFANASDDLNDDRKFDFNFHIKDMSGNDVDFRQFEGKVVFLNLWATWCSPCRSEMPSIQNLYNRIDHEKIAFVLLSIDDTRYFEKVKFFVKNQGFTYPTFVPSGNLPGLLQVPSIPTTFIINKKGTIVKQEVGMRNYDTKKFKTFLEELSK